MVFDFFPWKIDIDVEATAKMYEEELFPYERDLQLNEKIFDDMTLNQKAFFKLVAVDPKKSLMKEKIHHIPADGNMSESKISMLTINFLMKGKLLSISEFQYDIYCDEEVFGSKMIEKPERVTIGEDDNMTFDIDGLPCVFKHPVLTFGEEEFGEWDCGYVLGTILLSKDIED